MINKLDAKEAAQTAIARWRIERSLWDEVGTDAWNELKRYGASKLDKVDVEVVARNLWLVKEELKAKGVRLGDLCESAGLGQKGDYSKELYRMWLRPNGDSARVKLRRSAIKYRKVIEAICGATRESRSAVANRLLAGTSLHKVDKSEWDEVEVVQLTLQRLVDRVASDHALFATFLETAHLKTEHLNGGGACHWPLTGFEQSMPIDLHSAYWEKPVMVKKNPFFWWSTAFFESGCIQDMEFFYIPHAHLGRIEMFNLPDKEASVTVFQDALRREVERIRAHGLVVPKDEWDQGHECPVGQVLRESEVLQEEGWLVIYPTPDLRSLMPMLFIPLYEGGSFLLPLDSPNLRMLKKAYFIGPSETMPLFDRISQLLAPTGKGDPSQLEADLTRTAGWLQSNPHFKRQRALSARRQALIDYCDRLEATGSQPAEKELSPKPAPTQGATNRATPRSRQSYRKG